MEKEQRRAKRTGISLTLLMIDIDFFKAYNDHYGHQQGDDSLIKVAAALAKMLQRPADLIARYGGEEFAVILPEMDDKHSMRMAEAMRQTIVGLQIAHAKSEQGQHVTVSIGLASYTDEIGDIADLVGAADRALYTAKRAGRNRVVMHAADALPAS